MSAHVPDAGALAAALLPVDEARVHLASCSEALTRLRADLLRAEEQLRLGLRACNRARETLLQHQGRA